MSQLSQVSGRKEKKNGIIHKQSLKRDDTRNLTFCDYYCFCRKFCFVLALKSDEMLKSLRFWESLYLARKRHLYESPRGRIQKIQIAVAGKLASYRSLLPASYMDSFYFAAVIVKIIQKSTEKRRGWRRPSAILYIRAWSRWGFTILSRLNLFSVPCSPVFPV